MGRLTNWQVTTPYHTHVAEDIEFLVWRWPQSPSSSAYLIWYNTDSHILYYRDSGIWEIIGNYSTGWGPADVYTKAEIDSMLADLSDDIPTNISDLNNDLWLTADDIVSANEYEDLPESKNSDNVRYFVYTDTESLNN